MEYIPVQQAAENWGVSVRRVQQMCVADMIDGAKLFSKVWMIPENAVKPVDRRYKNQAQEKKANTDE